MPLINRRDFIIQSTTLPLLAAARPDTAPGSREWRAYGGDPLASRYSPCSQINTSNVARLKVAWVHRTKDASERPATMLECTPIVAHGVMYVSTPKVRVQAVDAYTGKLLWTFDPLGGRRTRRSPGVNRGVTYWEDGSARRIFATYQDQLWCLDAANGKPVPSFGKGGMIDLKDDFDHDMSELDFRHSSPVAVFEDIVMTGGGGGDSAYPEAPGHIRGFDARTGKRRWIFHTVPRPGEFGHETWSPECWKYSGGTNCWGGLSVDPQRGWVFAGIGSPAYDYWGGDRIGDNLFGNCVVALDARTGERKWHYQTARHDIWDYDLPCQPALVTIRQGGRAVDAVIQPSKQGFLFFLDRESGRPLFPVEDRPVAPSTMKDEVLAKTQPFPLKPAPLCRQGFQDDWITDISPEAHTHVKAIVETLARGPLYTPAAYDGGLIHPGFRGGNLWGGCCFDPERNLVFAGSDETSNVIRFEAAKEGMIVPFTLRERVQLLDPEGYPGIKPPWGYLTAVDADSGEFRWRLVNGEFAELTARGIPKTGCNSHGGSICTAGGLVFMAGTFDRKIRAFESDTGRVLWEYELPAGGFATPCTYEVKGKQFLVIAAGGGRNGSKARDEFIAFSL